MHLFRCLGEHRPWWLKAEWGGGLGNQRWVGPEPGTSSESLGDFRARALRCKEAVAEAEALSARRGSLPTPEDVLVLKDGFSRTLAVPDWDSASHSLLTSDGRSPAAVWGCWVQPSDG